MREVKPAPPSADADAGAGSSASAEVSAPENARPTAAYVIDQLKVVLFLRRMPLGRQIAHFARCLESEAFPALRNEEPGPVGVPLEAADYGRTAVLSDLSALEETFERLAAFLRRLGVESLVLETELESNQVRDVLEMLWSAKATLRGEQHPRSSRLTGRREEYDLLTSETGLHVACSEVKFDPESGRLSVRNSYCPLTFSRAAHAFMERSSGFDDHRAFFHAAPRYGLAAAVIVLAPLLMVLILGHTPELLIGVGVIMALLAGAATLVVFETIGAIQYDKEYQAKQLQRRHEDLVEAHGRIQADLERARNVQRKLVPDPDEQPYPDELSIGHTFVPQMAVGGDYYDFKALPDRKLAFLFADVSGHGMSSAFITGIIKTVFELHDLAHATPARFVADVNYVLEQITPVDSFAALIFGVYDLETGTVSYANAGHQPLPLVVRSDGRAQQPDATTGLVAGLRPNAQYEENRVELAQGDKLVLCTDGITESENENGELFSLGRLTDVLAEGAGRPAAEVPEMILQAVARHTGDTPQRDDQTVLVIEVLRQTARV